jgi:hypothetical protein
MVIEDLETACRKFEDVHGIDAFLAAMAEFMQRRLLRHGIHAEFEDHVHGGPMDAGEP